MLAVFLRLVLGWYRAQTLSPEAVIDYLVAAVKTFADDAPQTDDMTCVILKVEDCG